MAQHPEWSGYIPVLNLPARQRQKATMRNDKGSPQKRALAPQRSQGGADKGAEMEPKEADCPPQTTTQARTEAKTAGFGATSPSFGRTHNTGQEVKKDLSSSKSLQQNARDCRQARRQLCEAMGEHRDSFNAMMRDVKLICLTSDDRELAETQRKLRQYYELRSLVAYREAAGGPVTEEKKLILDQIASINAELELALAERQSAFQRRMALGSVGQPTFPQCAQGTDAEVKTRGNVVTEQRDGAKRVMEDLLASVTRLQQENQCLHEENVRLRRTIARLHTTQREAGKSQEHKSGGFSDKTSNAMTATPEVNTVTSWHHSPLKKRVGVRGWQNLICPANAPRSARLGAQQIAAILRAAGMDTDEPLKTTPSASTLISAFRLMHKRALHFKRKCTTLQSKYNRERLPKDARHSEGFAPLAEPEEEAFSLQWRTGILEAEVVRLRRLLELSSGTSLSLATIHHFFLDRRTSLQRQAATEVAAIEALETQFDIIQELSLACRPEGDTDESSDDFSYLAGHKSEAPIQRAAIPQPTGKHTSHSVLLEKAFRATFDAAVDALDALKERHAETTARLAQIQLGLINVEQDMKLLDKEQRLEMEKHMKELLKDEPGPNSQPSRSCYRRQLLGPGCADKESQTDANGIASRRLLYSGEYKINDSATCPVTVSLINEEDIVVKLMLEDMEYPLCLYMAFAGIKFMNSGAADNAQLAEHATKISLTNSPAGKDTAARVEAARRPTIKRRRTPDQADGQSIVELLEIEYVRGLPCLLLRGQEVGIPASQDPRPHTAYEEDCLYNDKLALGIVCPALGHPLILLLMQCARRRFGMLFFHLCVYNSITGWAKYASVSSKDVSRCLGYAGDRELLEAIGTVKRRGKIAETAVTKKILKLFEESFATDLPLAASSAPPVPVAQTFLPRTFVLCGRLGSDEKVEIVKQLQREKAKQLGSRTFMHGSEPPLPPVAPQYALGRCEQTLGASEDREPSNPHTTTFLEQQESDTHVFVYIKLCITWDCEVEILLGFE